MPATPPDSIVSEGHEMSGLVAMYDVATGHRISGTSSSANSELHIDASTERLQQENKQLRMSIDIMEQDIELEVARQLDMNCNKYMYTKGNWQFEII